MECVWFPFVSFCDAVSVPTVWVTCGTLTSQNGAAASDSVTITCSRGGGGGAQRWGGGQVGTCGGGATTGHWVHPPAGGPLSYLSMTGQRWPVQL